MKHDGLSLLADVARELTQPRNAHYPVKQRGQRRRLNPNTDGIRWLEGEAFERNTGFSDVRTSPDGLIIHRAHGADSGSHHARPMFELLKDNEDSFRRPEFGHTGCVGCDRVEYSRECPVHHEETGAPPAAASLNGDHRFGSGRLFFMEVARSC